MAFNFDGTDYLSIADHADLNIPTTDWTICGCFKVPPEVATGSGTIRLLQWGANGGGNERIIIFYAEDNAGFVNDNHIGVVIEDSVGTTSNVVYISTKNLTTMIGKWAFWCVTWEAATKQLTIRILDRDLHLYWSNTKTMTTAFLELNPATAMTIGADHLGGNNFKGDYGNVAFIPGIFFDGDDWHGYLHGGNPIKFPVDSWFVPMYYDRFTEIIGRGAYNLTMTKSGSGVTNAGDAPQMQLYMPHNYIAADDAEEVASAPLTFRPLIWDGDNVRRMQQGETLYSDIISTDSLQVGGYSPPRPTLDQQMLVATGPDSSSWITPPGNDYVLTSDATGIIAWEAQPDCWVITSTQISNWDTAYGWGDHAGLYDPLGTGSAAVASHEVTYDHGSYDTTVALVSSPTADNQLLQATGAGTAAWTTDIETLTSLQVDEINLNGSTITKASSTTALQFGSTRVTTGTEEGFLFSSNVTAGRTYGSHELHTGYADAGNQVRGRQVIVAPHCTGQLGYVIGEYMSLSAVGSGGSAAISAAYYVPEIATGGAEYSFYAFNTIRIGANNRGLWLGPDAKAALIFNDASDLVLRPNQTGSGSTTHFESSHTTLDALYKHNMGQYWIGEVAADRLQIGSNRTDGLGNIIDFVCTNDSMDGTDYNMQYLWAQNVGATKLMQFGYYTTGDSRYFFNSYASSGTPHPISFELNTLDCVRLSYISAGNYKWRVYSGTQIVSDKGDVRKVEPSESYYAGNGTQTGTVKIRFGWPIGNAMHHIVIKGFNYSGAHPGPWTLKFGGYDYTTGPLWYAQGCSVEGDPPFQSIRCGFESGYPVILLGDESTVWNYAWMYVDMVAASETFGAGDIEGAVAYTWDMSDDEATDWPLITGEAAVPMRPMPGCEIQDNGDGTITLLVNSVDISNPASGNTPAITGDNVTIYVATTGNDTTGNGSSGSPYATIARAILDCYRMVPSGDDKDYEYTITISVAAGHYTVGAPILPTYSYGAALKITGAYQDCDGSSATSYGSDTALITGLSYIDVSGVLVAGTTASVGDYLVVKAATGGTYPALVEGCHEITAWNSGTRAYTARVVRRAGVTAVPSGSITLTTAYVAKSVLSFASGNGIQVEGSYFGGTWDGICLVGNTSSYGVWCINSGSIRLESHFATNKWQINIYAQNQANIFADYTCHSYSNSSLVTANNGAVVNLRYGVPLTGSKTYGINCFLGSTISAYQARYSTSGGTAVINCYQGGFVESASSYIYYPNAAAYYAQAVIGGGVDISSSTVTGGVAATSATNGYVVGP